MRKIPLVTVAVSAYNEEENIIPFLKSILDQKQKGFVLKNIWVHSDGSSDKTVQLIKSLNSKKIRIWDHKDRKGKSTWLNKIYKDLTSDILVQTDADVIFAHSLVIRELIKPIVENEKVGMVGGNPVPIEGNSFLEKVVYSAFKPYQKFRSQVRGGDNIFSAIGQILAYRKELVKQITVPEDMVTNDIYTYFCCLSLGWKYKYEKKARVHYKSPETISDLLKQNIRFQVGQNRMFDYFDRELVEYEMSIPKKLKVTVLLKQLIKNPVYSATFYILNIYCRYVSSTTKELNAKWPMAFSTKKLITQ